MCFIIINIPGGHEKPCMTHFNFNAHAVAVKQQNRASLSHEGVCLSVHFFLINLVLISYLMLIKGCEWSWLTANPDQQLSRVAGWARPQKSDSIRQSPLRRLALNDVTNSHLRDILIWFLCSGDPLSIFIFSHLAFSADWICSVVMMISQLV